jgi:hypothetical protein
MQNRSAKASCKSPDRLFAARCILKSAFDREILDLSPMQRMSDPNMIVWGECPPLLSAQSQGGPDRGDRHVTQTLACDRCRSFAQRHHSGAYPGVCLARRLARRRMGLGWRMASRLGRMGPRLARRMGTWLGSWLGMASPRLGLGWTDLRRGPWILWRRLCCSPSCPWSVGSALGIGQSLLVVGDDYRRAICNPFRSTDGLTP